jgi:hypothetical protein
MHVQDLDGHRHLEPKPLEDADDRHAHVGMDFVDQAGGEQLNDCDRATHLGGS